MPDKLSEEWETLILKEKKNEGLRNSIPVCYYCNPCLNSKKKNQWFQISMEIPFDNTKTNSTLNLHLTSVNKF
jgi:hypothetical protein